MRSAFQAKLINGVWGDQQRVRAGQPDDTPVHVRWRTRDGSREQTLTLGELKRDVLEFMPGQKVCYVTDVSGHQRNRERLQEFIRGADLLFIETVFLEADRDLAARKAHLTTTQAGEIACAAGAKHTETFHFSARYRDLGEEMHRREFQKAWRSSMAPVRNGL
jgi:ribonuclease Z